jgi:hypothetical protein
MNSPIVTTFSPLSSSLLRPAAAKKLVDEGITTLEGWCMHMYMYMHVNDYADVHIHDIVHVHACI